MRYYFADPKLAFQIKSGILTVRKWKQEDEELDRRLEKLFNKQNKKLKELHGEEKEESGGDSEVEKAIRQYLQ